MAWRDFIDESSTDAIDLETWLTAQSPMNQTWIVGRIDDLREAASRGNLNHDPHAANDPSAKLVPLRADPDIYELRWKLLTTMVRQYHAEPSALPDDLVALNMHVKTNKAHQDASIDYSVNRYKAGEHSLWT